MILDVVANEERLAKVHPGFGPALEYLRRTNLSQLPEGRQEIDGSRLYALVIRGQGKGQKGAKLEAHRRYIDIQYSITGSDVIGWKPTATCRDPEQAYDEQKDLQFFRDAADSWVTIPEGSFGIYLPEDAHAPAAAEGPLHKIVVKVAVDWV
jgi:YhcH/YjgK/YiaL family protein